MKYGFIAGLAGTALVLVGCQSKPVVFSYSQDPAVYCLSPGVAISPNTPTITSGTAARFSVSPNLPMGLSLNQTDGKISGTPIAATPAADYVVSATGPSGDVAGADTINITVTAPASISYTSPITMAPGTAVAPIMPATTGGAITDCSIRPPPPAGLMINRTTCAISGTPTMASAAADYMVFVTSACGTDSVKVSLAVVAPEPAKKAKAHVTPTQVTTKKSTAKKVKSGGKWH